MKKNDQSQYIKLLEQRLIAAEKDNKHLRLQVEAYETAIQIAEDQFKIPVLKKSVTKQSRR